MSNLIINKDSDKLTKIKNRADSHDGEYLQVVSNILSDIKLRGDEALFEYTAKFDKFDINSNNIKVTEKELNDAYKATDKELIKAIENASANVFDFHKLQLEKTWLVNKGGSMLGQKVTPLDRVGVYVPGGKAAYFSSVLMNVLPAKAAGVGEIIMTTPAPNGELNNAVLVAAMVAGADKIYKVGGAQAIGALAYGTQTIQKVDKITGPGNIYVATAKKLVFGHVDIDMIAGPSEVLIIADSSASAEHVAADMLAQCEHDELASAVCVTPDKQLANEIEKELYKQLETLPKKDIAKKSLEEFSAIIVVDSLDEACEVSNEIAPEHLELHMQSPMDYLNKVKHAGAIFMGEYSPEALGDYYAGPNHVLPTGGTARFFSPLGTYDFIKRSSIIYYDRDSFVSASDDVAKLAKAEGLEAHAQSVLKRL